MAKVAYRFIRNNKSRLYYRYAQGPTAIGNVSGFSVQVWPLTSPQTWGAVFGSNTSANNLSEKATLRMLYWGGRLDMGNENSIVDYSLFIVQPKGRIDTSISGGVPSFAINIDYELTTGQEPSQVMWNLNRWIIHYKRRFSTGAAIVNPATGDAELAGAIIHRFKFVKKMYTQMWQTNAVVDARWQTLPQLPRNEDNLYLVVFSNNLTGDLENPQFRFTTLYSVESM